MFPLNKDEGSNNKENEGRGTYYWECKHNFIYQCCIWRHFQVWGFFIKLAVICKFNWSWRVSRKDLWFSYQCEDCSLLLFHRSIYTYMYQQLQCFCSFFLWLRSGGLVRLSFSWLTQLTPSPWKEVMWHWAVHSSMYGVVIRPDILCIGNVNWKMNLLRRYLIGIKCTVVSLVERGTWSR